MLVSLDKSVAEAAPQSVHSFIEGVGDVWSAGGRGGREGAGVKQVQLITLCGFPPTAPPELFFWSPKLF